jgi:hypothetical protein
LLLLLLLLSLLLLLTCGALPDDSLKPGNYASRARPSAPDGPHAPERKTIVSDRAAEKFFARKAIKKGTAKPKKTSLGKKSICVSRRLGAMK